MTAECFHRPMNYERAEMNLRGSGCHVLAFHSGLGGSGAESQVSFLLPHHMPSSGPTHRQACYKDSKCTKVVQAAFCFNVIERVLCSRPDLDMLVVEEHIMRPCYVTHSLLSNPLRFYVPLIFAIGYCVLQLIVPRALIPRMALSPFPCNDA